MVVMNSSSCVCSFVSMLQWVARVATLRHAIEVTAWAAAKPGQHHPARNSPTSVQDRLTYSTVGIMDAQSSMTWTQKRSYAGCPRF